MGGLLIGLVLLTAVLSSLSVGAIDGVNDVRYEKTTAIPFASAVWPFPPQWELHVDMEVLRSGRHNASENAKLLAKLGVPFIMDFKSPTLMRALIDIVLFVGTDDADGVCPSTFTYEATLRYAMDPSALDELYGEQRLQGLREVARLPPEWRVARSQQDTHDRIVNITALSAAEVFIAQLPSASPPGLLMVAVPRWWSEHIGAANVTLADLTLETAGASTSRLPRLMVDVASVVHRQQLRKWILAKQTYAARIFEYDSELKREVKRVLSLAREGAEAEQRAREDGEQLLRNYRAFKAEQREARDTEAQRSQSQGVESSVVLQHHIASVEQRRAGSCLKIGKALETLHTQGALAEMDSRVVHLQLLRRKYKCSGSSTEFSSGASTTTSNDGCDAIATSCATLCDALGHLSQWHVHTGRPLTISQSIALLLSAHSAMNESQQDGREFSVEGFYLSAAQLVRGRRVQCCATQCAIPFHVVAGLHYAMGYLQLVRPELPPPSSQEQQLSRPTADTRWREALVDFQQALWSGSRHAAAALATLRENGIAVRRHGKAAVALLLHSMRDVPTAHLFDQLLEHQRVGSSSATGAATTVSAERLLRNERPFNHENTLSTVNTPELTQARMEVLFSLTESGVTGGGDDDDGNSADFSDLFSEEPVHVNDTRSSPKTYQLFTHLFKGHALLYGLHGTRRDLREAECLLLTTLRRLRYTCDIALLEQVVTSSVTEDNPQSWLFKARQQGVITLMNSGCDGNDNGLADLKYHLKTHPLIACSPPHQRGSVFFAASTAGVERTPPPLVTPHAEVHHKMLKETLVELSYVYLLDGHQYDRAAVYAELALRLDHAVYNFSLNTLQSLSARNETRSKISVRPSPQNATVRGPQWAFRLLRKRIGAEGAGRLDGLDDLLSDALVMRRRKNTSSAIAPEDVSLVFPHLIDSGLVSSETFTLVAMIGLLGEEQNRQRHGGTENRGVAQERITALFADVFGASHFAGTNNTDLSSFRKKEDQLFRYGCLCMLMAAAASQRGAGENVWFLDKMRNSVHLVDAFYLLSRLVNEDRSTGGDSRTAPFILEHFQDAINTKLRDLVSTGSHTYAPAVWESISSYTKRLLRAVRETTQLSGSELHLATCVTQVSAHQALIDDASPSLYTLSLARVANLHLQDISQLEPLLLSSDLQAFYDPTHRLTRLQRVIRAAIEGLRYVFTETNEESLVRRLAAHTLSPYEDSSKGNGYFPKIETPAPFAEMFALAFSKSAELREMTIALQLLSIALETGTPHAFSLVFLESEERNNTFLKPFAAYMANSVLHPSVIRTMWIDHHISAQWHLENPHTLNYPQHFSISMRSRPFFTEVAAEDRQEVMARAGRWQASRALSLAEDAERAGDHGAAASHRQDAEESLLLCSGVLVHDAYLRSGRDLLKALQRLPRSPYDGMSFPAANQQCLTDLISYLWSTHGVSSSEPLLPLVRDLTHRLGIHYGIIDPKTEPVVDILPSLSIVLGSRDISETRVTAAEFPAHSVEPWNHFDSDRSDALREGEGAFYYSRLHTVTGSRTGAQWLQVGIKITKWWRKLFGAFSALR